KQIELHIEFKISIFSYLFNSQGLAENVYNLEVNAPTGQISTTVPDKIDNKFSFFVTISVSSPLPTIAKPSKFSISLKKRTQRVQCIQRVIILFIKKPLSLSNTLLFANS